MRKVTDLENVISSWKISGHIPKNNDERARSKYHLKARRLLKDKFPTCQILEEVPVKVRRGQVLYLDFYIPLHDLCVEVQLRNFVLLRSQKTLAIILLHQQIVTGT